MAQRYGMGVLVWSPLCRGWLTGRTGATGSTSRPRLAPRVGRSGETRSPRQFDRPRPENQRKLDLVESLAKISADAGISMTHMAIAFTLAHPGVTSAIIGPRTMEQLADVLAGADVRLDEATLDAIDELVPPGTSSTRTTAGFSPWWLEASARRR